MAEERKGFFGRLFGRRSSKPIQTEADLQFKVVAAPKDDENLDTSNDLVRTLDESRAVSYSDINNFTQLAERRDQRYVVYDEMRQNDSLAAAVLEMYADDITQPDPQGRAIWIESENANCAEAGNRLLRILKVDENIWATAYSLVCYGDVYFELFRTPRKGSLFNEAQVVVHKEPKNYALVDYIERITDPSEIFDLVSNGQTVGFARTHINENKVDSDKWNSIYNSWNYKVDRNDIDLYDSQKFVHIYVPDAGVRHPYKFVISDEASSVSGGTEYTVSTGKSLLQDAYKTSQQLQLMETSILLSRLTRSSIYRLIQVQVGQKSEVDTISLLNRIKNLLDKKQTINSTTGTFGSYANPGPEVSNIIIPVKENGQGSIQTNTIGGDYDPKTLTDLDYLVNKELAAFKVPRQFLNFTDGGGFNGGSSLAKISSQYAHRIVRYKRAIIAGIDKLINVYFNNRYPDYVGKFEVKMTPINTVEDTERVETARQKLDMVGQIMDQLDQMDDTVGKFKILKDAFEDAYPNSVVSKVLDDYIQKLEAGYGGSSKSEEGGDELGGSDSFRSGSDSSPIDIDLDIDSDSDSGDELGGTDSDFPTDLSGDIDYTDTAAVDALVGDEEA